MSDTELRLSKIDDAIQRLAQVSADLSKMMAVQEQRLIQQEKGADLLAKLVENRRVEVEDKIDGVYNSFRSEDRQILEELRKMKDSATAQHQEQNTRINKIEKLIWVVSGGLGVIGYIINVATTYYKALH